MQNLEAAPSLSWNSLEVECDFGELFSFSGQIDFLSFPHTRKAYYFDQAKIFRTFNQTTLDAFKLLDVPTISGLSSWSPLRVARSCKIEIPRALNFIISTSRESVAETFSTLSTITIAESCFTWIVRHAVKVPEKVVHILLESPFPAILFNPQCRCHRQSD